MYNFLMGVIFMYLLCMPLLLHMTEPMDEENPNAPYMFALMWPLAAIEVLYHTLRGNYKDDDGTGSD